MRKCHVHEKVGTDQRKYYNYNQDFGLQFSYDGLHNIIFSDAWGEWQKNANAEPNKCLG